MTLTPEEYILEIRGIAAELKPHERAWWIGLAAALAASQERVGELEELRAWKAGAIVRHWYSLRDATVADFEQDAKDALRAHGQWTKSR